MKRTFALGTKIFGEGSPKICVPIVADHRDAIWKKAEEIAALPVDVVEWRADFYQDVFQTEEVTATLRGLKQRLDGKALLFTFRTNREGGSRFVEKEEYYRLNREAAASGCADLIDIEAFLDENRTAEVIRGIHAAGSRVITSNHEFEKTPPVEEMVRRLRRMEELGTDAAKLAVMPQNRQDVLKLLQAAVTADEMLAVPVVTMSMGRIGVVSRIAGDLTGSAMTFAAVGEISAPGQIPAEKMTEFLKITSPVEL